MVEKRVRQTISDEDDDDDDDRQLDIIFVMCIRILKMNTFFGFYSNTLEYCHMSQTGTTFHHATFLNLRANE